MLVPNLLGNGVSFSPSTEPEADGALNNSTEPEPEADGAAAFPRDVDAARAMKCAAAFPRLVTIADNVRAQHALLSSLGVHLGGALNNSGGADGPGSSSTVHHSASRSISLIYGFSMGALQVRL